MPDLICIQVSCKRENIRNLIDALEEMEGRGLLEQPISIVPSFTPFGGKPYREFIKDGQGNEIEVTSHEMVEGDGR